MRGVIGRKEGSSPSRPALLLIRPDLMLDYCTEGLGGTEIYGYRVGGWVGVGASAWCAVLELSNNHETFSRVFPVGVGS